MSFLVYQTCCLGVIEEKAAKKSIAWYDKSKVDDTHALMLKVKEACNCEIEHLESIGSFVLTYASADHMAASKLLQIPHITHAQEDHVIKMITDDKRSHLSDRDFEDQWALDDKIF